MIEDYYRTLTVLEKTETNNGLGGKIRSWDSVGTIQGSINSNTLNKMVKGKLIEVSSYILCCELNDLINSSSRIQDSDNSRIYRVEGTPENIVSLDHHLEVDLTYHNDDNES